jgi:hypothetical protein
MPIIQDSRFELHTHPPGVPPHGDTAVGHMIGRVVEGQVKFREQKHGIRQSQSSTSGRKVSHSAIDERAPIKHDRTGYAGQMPRVDSPFDTSVFRSDEMIGLALRQMQPALGLKHVMTLSP